MGFCFREDYFMGGTESWFFPVYCLFCLKKSEASNPAIFQITESWLKKTKPDGFLISPTMIIFIKICPSIVKTMCTTYIWYIIHTFVHLKSCSLISKNNWEKNLNYCKLCNRVQSRYWSEKSKGVGQVRSINVQETCFLSSKIKANIHQVQIFSITFWNLYHGCL